MTALLLVLSLAAGEAPHSAGWHSRHAGSWPWTTSRSKGSYQCLRWNHGGESYDTLVSPDYFIRGCDSCFLWVRSYYEPGTAFPGAADLPTIQLLVSVDGGRWWDEVRYYGLRPFDSLERIDVSRWARANRTIQFAWASHVYDSANVRWWCVGDVKLKVYPRPDSGLAITRVLQPRTDMVYATGDAVSPVLMLSSFGKMVSGDLAMQVWADDQTDRYDMQVLQQHCMLDDPWDWGGQWSLPAGEHKLRARLGRYVSVDTGDQQVVFEPSGEDSVSVDVRFADNIWQLQNEYPGPDRLVAPGFAIAADRKKRLFVRNCGALDDRDTSNTRLFLTWSLANGNWSSVRSYDAFARSGAPAFEAGGAVVAQDSLLYIMDGPDRPLQRWNIKRDRWGLTRPMPIERPVSPESEPAVLPALCWDDDDGVYAVGPAGILRYSIAGDRWTQVKTANRRAFGRLPRFGGAAIVDMRLYVAFADGSFRAYELRADTWQTLPSLPDADTLAICSLAGDPGCGVVYALTDSPGLHRSFVAYDIADRRWLTDLPQPRWKEGTYMLRPGAALTRGGPYLFAFNGHDNDLHVYSLPPPHKGLIRDKVNPYDQ